MMNKIWEETKPLLIGFIVFGLMALITPGLVFAGGNHGNDECAHPRFQEVGCTYPGEQGPPGADGKDGVDGKDGRDGRDGIDGKDGIVPTEWITETRYRYDRLRDSTAALAALESHLPQYSNQRLQFNTAHVEGRTAVGFGYAYMLDDERNAGLTFSMGRAGSETAVRASFGFEFGSDRQMKVDIAHLAPAAPAPAADPDVVTLPTDEYEALLMAQVQQEELDEQREFVEDRLAEYDSLIQAQQTELEIQREEIASHQDEQAEIERLKQEAAELRAAEEARAARRAAVRAKLLNKGQDDGSEGDNQ